MKVRNLLHQPLELDFGKDEDVVRFNARETKDVDDKYAEHKVFLRNSKDLQVLTKPRTTKEKATDSETEK